MLCIVITCIIVTKLCTADLNNNTFSNEKFLHKHLWDQNTYHLLKIISKIIDKDQDKNRICYQDLNHLIAEASSGTQWAMKSKFLHFIKQSLKSTFYSFIAILK